MNIIQLSYFLAVYDHGSYAAAAKELYTSRQTLGRAVYELEHELDQKLFEREGRSITPTEFGHEAAETTRTILSSVDKLKRLAGGIRDDEPQKFTLGVLDNEFRGNFLDQSSIEEQLSKTPGIDLSIQYLGSEQCEKAVIVKATDAAICLGKNELPALSYEFIGKQNAYLAMDKNHPFAAKKALTMEDLGHSKLAQPANLGFLFQRVNALCEAYGVLPEWAFVRQNEDDFRAFIHNGGMVFVMPNCQLLCHDSDIVAVPMAESTNLTYPFYFVERKKDRTHLSHTVMKSSMDFFYRYADVPNEEDAKGKIKRSSEDNKK